MTSISSVSGGSRCFTGSTLVMNVTCYTRAKRRGRGLSFASGGGGSVSEISLPSGVDSEAEDSLSWRVLRLPVFLPLPRPRAPLPLPLPLVLVFAKPGPPSPSMLSGTRFVLFFFGPASSSELSGTAASTVGVTLRDELFFLKSDTTFCNLLLAYAVRFLGAYVP